jgi:hypothetical protein
MRREGYHPRYRCVDHMQYIAGYALPPYVVDRQHRAKGSKYTVLSLYAVASRFTRCPASGRMGYWPQHLVPGRARDRFFA